MIEPHDRDREMFNLGIYGLRAADALARAKADAAAGLVPEDPYAEAGVLALLAVVRELRLGPR